MADIFISYSRDDRDFMLTLRDNLLALGFDVWVDVDGLTVGTSSWADAIDAALRRVDVVIVILSPSAHASEWVNREILRAQTLGKPIFPVLADGDDTSAVPFVLVGAQYADMRVSGDRQAAFKTLAAHIGKQVGREIPAFRYVFSGGYPWGMVQCDGAPGKAISIGQELAGAQSEQEARQERRLEAAMPHRTRVGSETECRVKISLPDSKGLRGELPAVTLAGDLIRKSDVSGSTFPCVFPVEERTGKLLPATLCVKVASSDFRVRSETRINRLCSVDEVELSLPPEHDSRTVVFELSPAPGQQPGRSRMVVTVSDGENVLAQTVVVTELVQEGSPLKEITWNVVSLLMQATSAPLAGATSTVNITVGGNVEGGLNVAGRDVTLDKKEAKEASRRREAEAETEEDDEIDTFGEMPKGAPQPAPVTSSPASPVMRPPTQESRGRVAAPAPKSAAGGRWLVAALIVVAIIVLILLAINGGWFGG